jgi:thymidine kinase
MAELTFFYGTMNCGKSTLALQMHHNAVHAGKAVLLFTRHDREGAVISSRIGLRQPAWTVDDDTDLYAVVRDRIRSGERVDELVCDEAPFYTPVQIEQLARVVDDFDVDVHAFGLLTDFTTHLFPGAQRLIELADRRRELQVEARCWCGARGTHNARTVGGLIVREGSLVVVGDVDGGAAVPGEVAYEVLCRRHHREGVTRAVADAAPDASADASPGLHEIPAEHPQVP